MNAKVREWEVRLGASQVVHYAAAERYLRLNAVLGMPMVILSSFVSALLFFDQAHSTVDVFLKAGGILVAVLASIQAFVRPAEKAELHRIKATKYGGLKRKTEIYLCQEPSPERFQIFSKELMTEWDAIAEDSPTTPDKMRKRIKEILDENKQLKRERVTA